MKNRRIIKLQNHRNAQASPAQVFIYVFSAIVAGLVLLYGYSVVKNMGNKNLEIQKLEFRTELENAVKEISSDYGSVRKLTIRVPGDFKEVCFVGSSCIKKAGSCPMSIASISDTYFIIKDVASSPDPRNKNVFLYPKGTESFDVSNIEVYDSAGKISVGFKCYTRTSGKITIFLEGKGNYAKIYGED